MPVVGTRKRLIITVTDETTDPPELADPSAMTVTVQHASDDPDIYELDDLETDGEGLYHLDVDCPDAGQYTARAECTGTLVAAVEASWRVRSSAIVEGT